MNSIQFTFFIEYFEKMNISGELNIFKINGFLILKKEVLAVTFCYWYCSLRRMKRHFPVIFNKLFEVNCTRQYCFGIKGFPAHAILFSRNLFKKNEIVLCFIEPHYLYNKRVISEFQIISEIQIQIPEGFKRFARAVDPFIIFPFYFIWKLALKKFEEYHISLH